jgi:glyoxylase-like metal-dependent hydrolase (beta-lactamase superfamily II)
MTVSSLLAALRPLGFTLPFVLLQSGCVASHHATTPAELGVVRSSDDMVAVLMEPGAIDFEKVVAADWEVDRSGLINLDHPKARAAELEAGPEPIQIYFYALKHPQYGTFIVDSGVASEFSEPASSERIGFLVRNAMHTDALQVRVTTADWVAANGGRLDGVFLTHLHIDHIMGVADLHPDTPIYAGPGETEAEAFLNAFTSGTIDGLLEGASPVREWGFAADSAGRFAGVLDVFGDGSVWALHVPGHTPGSTAFVVRTPDGPELLLGDATHTVWGWENGVEPGTFSHDQPRSAESLATLLKLSADFPGLRVHPGHQSLGADTTAVSVR